MLIIYTTLPDIKTARHIAKKIIETKLAACVNIIPQIESHYMWNDKVESSEEVIILCKTNNNHAAQLMKYISIQHPYEVPAIFSIKSENIDNKFQQWLEDSLK